MGLVVRDILNGKLEKSGIRYEDDDDDEEEEMPENTGDRVYDSSERDGCYEPIRTSPEEDVIKIHTDGKIPQGEKTENTIRRSSRSIKKPSSYGSVPYTENFWDNKIINVCNDTGSNWNVGKGTPQPQITHQPNKSKE